MRLMQSITIKTKEIECMSVVCLKVMKVHKWTKYELDQSKDYFLCTPFQHTAVSQLTNKVEKVDAGKNNFLTKPKKS